MRHSDTPVAVRRRQAAALAALSPSQRLARGMELNQVGFDLATAGIRMRHPEYDDEQVRLAMARKRFGDDLFRAAYPDRPLLDP